MADNINRHQAEQALSAQADRDQRLDIADDILKNSGPANAIVQAVEQLHLDYIDLAQTLHNPGTE